MRMVNQADPIRPKTLQVSATLGKSFVSLIVDNIQDCQKYWKLSRQKLLDCSVTGW